ncbi:MAG: hypothetical protein ACYDCL_13750 [Myxococcales bacterium]
MRSRSLAALSLLPVLAVLQPAAALAQTRLHITADENDRPYQVQARDAVGRPANCTLPPASGCRFTLSPGPLQLDVGSKGETLTTTLQLPPEGADLELTHHGSVMGWVGVGVMGEGAADIASALALLVMSSAAPARPTGVSTTTFGSAQLNQTLGLEADVLIALGVVVVVAGAIVTGIGFHRAGPQAAMKPLSDEPPALLPPPPDVPPPLPPPPDPVPAWDTPTSSAPRTRGTAVSALAPTPCRHPKVPALAPPG